LKHDSGCFLPPFSAFDAHIFCNENIFPLVETSPFIFPLEGHICTRISLGVIEQLRKGVKTHVGILEAYQKGMNLKNTDRFIVFDVVPNRQGR